MILHDEMKVDCFILIHIFNSREAIVTVIIRSILVAREASHLRLKLWTGML